MIPVAYAGGDDDDGNKNKTEDDSAAAIADCDQAIAANDIDIDLGEDIVLGFVDGIPSVYPRN